MADDEKRSLDDVSPDGAPEAKKSVFKTRYFFLIPIGVIVLLSLGFNFLKTFQERRLNSEPYMRANDFYAEGFEDYKRGNFKVARESLLKALESQPVPPESQPVPPERQLPGMPPYRANAVTHNATALLAIISAKINDCPSYWKYRNQTEKVARSDWTFVLNGEINKQDNQKDSMMKKIDVVRDAAGKILSLEYACPAPGGAPGLGGLPVSKPEAGGGDEKALRNQKSKQ